ncbi:hypothetical protein M9458_007158, partial [Cirrhinus mrigala]
VFRLWSLPGNSAAFGRRHHQFSVLDRGQLPSLHGPPRHLWTELEGSIRPRSRTAQLSSLSADQHPEPSQPTPQLAEPEPEPTMDGEPEPRATEPSPRGATVQKIATEPKPSPSDQVREPATWPAAVDVP